MKSTKIFVLKLKSILYTVLIISIGMILLFFALSLFGNTNKETAPTCAYVPGLYTSSVYLDEQAVKIEVIVDKNHINSIKLREISPNVSALYPLLEPVMLTLEDQVITSQSLNKQDLEIKAQHQYTSKLLLSGIEYALDKGRKPDIHK